MEILILFGKMLSIIVVFLASESFFSKVSKRVFTKKLTSADSLGELSLKSLMIRYYTLKNYKHTSTEVVFSHFVCVVGLVLGLSIIPFSESIYLKKTLINSQLLNLGPDLMISGLIIILVIVCLGVMQIQRSESSVFSLFAYPVLIFLIISTAAYEYGTLSFIEIIQSQLAQKSILGIDLGFYKMPHVCLIYYAVFIMFLIDSKDTGPVREKGNQESPSSRIAYAILLKAISFYLGCLGVVLFFGGYGVPQFVAGWIPKGNWISYLLYLFVFYTKYFLIMRAVGSLQKRCVSKYQNVRASEITTMIIPLLGTVFAASVIFRLVGT
jgi:hypothetical protein